MEPFPADMEPYSTVWTIWNHANYFRTNLTLDEPTAFHIELYQVGWNLFAGQCSGHTQWL